MIRLCHNEIGGKLGVLARLDGANTTMDPDITKYRLLFSVEEASASGADGVTTMAFIGAEDKSQNLESVGRVSQEFLRQRMPRVVGALPPEIVEHHFKREASGGGQIQNM